MGTSQGIIAAVNGAGHSPDVAAVVLLEALSRHGGSGETVFDADLGAVTARALLAANAADRRPVTPPEDADRVAAAFTAARSVEALRIDGSEPGGRDCGPLSPRGHLGIEGAVADGVAGWLGR